MTLNGIPGDIVRAVRKAVETATVNRRIDAETNKTVLDEQVGFTVASRAGLQRAMTSDQRLVWAADACDIEMRRQLDEGSLDGAWAAHKLKEGLHSILPPRRDYRSGPDGSPM